MTTITMITLNQQAHATPSAASSGTQAALTSRIKECITLLSRVIDRQRQRRALLELDDHLLNDIGVSRGEAIAEGRKPSWR
jgi:uncharacterized protein YjiS (DUF1127 family)